MSKVKTAFICQSCGADFPKWQGQCAACLEWNSLVEEVQIKKSSNPRTGGFAGENSKLTALIDVKIQAQPRLATGMAEFDHVLGGGLVSDSVILIGGDPGIGKSTLILQIIAQLSKNYSCLYVTGEESLQQIALRAQRLEVQNPDLPLLAETSVEKITAITQQLKPKVLVIDSIQTVHTDLLNSAPGGVGQVRESAAQLVRFAKQTGTALILIGHVTKDGTIAGPRVLEHMVDAVLYFEGRSDSRFRIIRAVKNRFGAVNEIGVFAMTDTGLKEVTNPSAIFLSQQNTGASGSGVMVTWEGSRPLLVEVQALVTESHLGNPRRVTVGLDHNRLSMLLAVLQRHGGIHTYDQDVFVNIVGGLRILETGADLAVMLAVLSSLKNKALPNDLVVFGEIGLSGEIRPVPSGQERIKEAQKHGFKKAIVPKGNAPKKSLPGIEVVGVDNLAGALAAL